MAINDVYQVEFIYGPFKSEPPTYQNYVLILRLELNNIMGVFSTLKFNITSSSMQLIY